MKTTKEITLQTIAELIEKNQKIANGLDAFLEETESERERLLVSARAKLESYFNQVLDLMPFNKLNVQIDSDTDIFLRNYPGGQPALDFILCDYVTTVVIYHRRHFYAIKKEQEGMYWEAEDEIEEMPDHVLLLLVKYFESLKEETERQLKEDIRLMYRDNTDIISRRKEEIDMLVDFLADN